MRVWRQQNGWCAFRVDGTLVHPFFFVSTSRAKERCLRPFSVDNNKFTDCNRSSFHTVMFRVFARQQMHMLTHRNSETAIQPKTADVDVMNSVYQSRLLGAFVGLVVGRVVGRAVGPAVVGSREAEHGSQLVASRSVHKSSESQL
jgi:hypothetical protein